MSSASTSAIQRCCRADQAGGVTVAVIWGLCPSGRGRHAPYGCGDLPGRGKGKGTATERPSLSGLRAKSAPVLGDSQLPHARSPRWSTLRHAAAGAVLLRRPWVTKVSRSSGSRPPCYCTAGYIGLTLADDHVRSISGRECRFGWRSGYRCRSPPRRCAATRAGRSGPAGRSAPCGHW
jgi:hypothetical protein